MMAKRWQNLSPKERFIEKIKINPETNCWEWQACISNKGYGVININKKSILAHRYAYETFVGPINNLHVLHRCDNRKCVNYNHLFLGTNQDNVDDKVNKKRQNFGEKVWNHKLSDDEVDEIKKALKYYYRGQLKDLAHFYKVDPATISDIKRGLTWSHVEVD
jgi:hypothetical protein